MEITVVVFTLFNRVLTKYMTTRHNTVVVAEQVRNEILINSFPLKYKNNKLYILSLARRLATVVMARPELSLQNIERPSCLKFLQHSEGISNISDLLCIATTLFETCKYIRHR